MCLDLIVMAMKCNFGGSARKLIGIKLADCANARGEGIYPSHETLASVAECSTKTVQRTIKEWTSLNLLYETYPYGLEGRVHLNYFLPMLEALADKEVEFYNPNPGSRETIYSLRPINKPGGRPVHWGKYSLDGPSEKKTARQKSGRPVQKKDGPSTEPVYNQFITSHNNLEGGNDDLLKLLFEEFKQAAGQFKFVVPRDSTFKVNIDNFKTTIETLGVDAWREALAYAMTDKACTGKLPPMTGHDKPWRLSFVKMCDTDWLVRKLDYWRDQNPTPQIVTMTEAIMITPDDDCWDDWLAYYQVTQPGRARLMKNYKQFAVETKTPPKIEETPCK